MLKKLGWGRIMSVLDKALSAVVLYVAIAAAPILAAGTPFPINPTTPLPSTFTPGTAAVYTSRATFDANSGPTVVQDFEFVPAITTIPSMGFASGQFTDANGTTFSLATVPPAGYNGPIELNLLDSTYLPSTGSYIGNHYGSDVLGSNYSDVIFSFDHIVNAFGLDFGSFGRAFVDKSDVFGFTVNGLGTQTVVSNTGATKFFGLTSATGFTSISIRTSNDTQRVYDKVAISSPSIAAVPEPAIWLMMLMGFGLVGLCARRKLRQSEECFTEQVRLIAAS